MDLNRFVEERRPRWRRLERLVGRIETGSIHDLAEGTDVKPQATSPRAENALEPGVAEARELAALYRAASADLIRARTETANAELIGYLNGLVARAYAAIYRGRRTLRLKAAAVFLLLGFPRRFRAHLGAFAAAFGFCLAGFLLGLVAEWFDPAAKHFLLPEKVAALEEDIQRSPAVAGGTPMAVSQNLFASSHIMTNNIGVSFLALALGATGGIGTALVLFYNGILIGVLTAIFVRHGLGVGFAALIVPHGVIELTAIFIAGGAGFLIAKAVVAPGDQGRRAALLEQGRAAVELVIGCAFLLVIAGLIEGFITPQPLIGPEVKLAIGLVTGVVLLVHLVFGEGLLAAIGALEGLDPDLAAARKESA